jgi:hypothetical protein
MRGTQDGFSTFYDSDAIEALAFVAGGAGVGDDRGAGDRAGGEARGARQLSEGAPMSFWTCSPIKWHMRKALAPLLFDNPGRENGGKGARVRAGRQVESKGRGHPRQDPPRMKRTRKSQRRMTYWSSIVNRDTGGAASSRRALLLCPLKSGKVRHVRPACIRDGSR